LKQHLGSKAYQSAEGLKMTRTLKALALGFALLMASNSVGYAQDFQKGLAAYIKGDYATALREWRPLAEQGLAAAQYNLGWMYDNGKGVIQDYAEAAKWYRKAAEQGDAKALSNLGVMYAKGQGVIQDYKEAVKWYRKAAEQGNAIAWLNLGAMYENGQGVTQDYKEAVKWYRRAAEQGYAKAQHNLGVMYYKGQGVIQDNVYAHMWFNIAASNGAGADATKNRDIVAKRLTPADISKAQELARECVRKKYKGC
jgi:TPR repeat protein